MVGLGQGLGSTLRRVTGIDPAGADGIDAISGPRLIARAWVSAISPPLLAA
jgi:hypothetical protein